MYHPIPFLEACARRYGDTFQVRLPHRTSFVMTSDPQIIRRVFTAAPHEYDVRGAHVILRPLVGDASLLLLDGDRHLQERRLMAPPFHGERMQVYGDLVVEATEADMATWPRDRSFSLHDAMQRITLDVILRAVFGVAMGRDLAEFRRIIPRMLDAVANPITLLLAATGEVVIPWFLRPFERWLPKRNFEGTRSEVDALLYAEIARKRAEPPGGDDILRMLIEARYENGEGLSDEALRDEMVTLLVAGHETSATTLSWTFCHLLQNPRALRRLLDELDEVVGDGPVTAAHLPGLPYLDATLKEALRMTPILPFVGRRLTGPWEVGAYRFEAGTTLAPCVYLAHHRSDQWARPASFEPERFLDERLNPNAWFPFGGGARRCVGMAFAMFEMRMVLATVLRRVRLRFAPRYRPRVVRRSITLAPSRGVPVRID